MGIEYKRMYQENQMVGRIRSLLKNHGYMGTINYMMTQAMSSQKFIDNAR